jgi:hypothetical protein
MIHLRTSIGALDRFTGSVVVAVRGSTRPKPN